MANIIHWLKNHMPTKRRLIQLYTALLYNANIKGFTKGTIYTGNTKAVCVPGFNCYSCPGAIGACPLGSLQNALGSVQHRAPYYVFGILMLFGLMFGRVICGFLCPVGLMQELLHKIPSPKLKKNRVTKALSYLKYVILAVFVIFIPLYYSFQQLPMPGFCKYICPAGTFEGAVGLLSNPVNADKFSMLGSLFTRKFVILVALAVSSIFVYRSFCRFICPLGAIYGFFSRIALLGIRVDESKCTTCGLCKAHCPVDIKRVGDHECIQCGACREVCPTKAIEWKGGKILLNKNETAKEGQTAKKKLNPKEIAAWACALIVLVGALVYYNRPVNAQETPVIPQVDTSIPVGGEVGMRCPDFTVTTRSGETFSVSASLGKVTVINFWATWCTPCVNELPHFQKLWEAYPDTVEVIALHSNLVTDDWNKFLDTKGYTMPFALDETGDIIKSLNGALMLPQTIIVDQSGVIVYNQVGSVTYEALEALIHPLLKGE